MFVVNDPIARATFDALADHVALLNSDGIILEVNRAWHEFATRVLSQQNTTSSDAQQLIGRRFLEFHDPSVTNENGVSLADALSAIFKGERESFSYEYSQKAGKEEFWFAVRITSCKDCDPVCAVVVREDITARKNLEDEREQIKRELWTQQGLFGEVLRQMPAGVVIAEAPSGKLVLENDKVSQVLRQPLLPINNIEEYRNYPIFEIDGKPLRPTEYPLVRSLMYGETVQNKDVEYVCGDGIRRTLRTNSAPVYDDRNRVIAGVLTLHDVTTEHEHEEAMRRSETRYRSLVTAISEIVWTTNGDGEIIEPSPTWTDFTSHTFEEYQGHGWVKALHPDDVERAAADFRCAIENRSTYESQYRVLHRDGTYRHMIARGAPVLDRYGNVLEWIGICVDITSQVLAQELQRRSEERYELAATAGKVGVWEWEVGSEELFLASNLKTLLGYTDEELPNQMDAWCALVHPDDKEKAISATQAHLEGHTPQYEVEVRRRHKDGEYRWFLARGYALRDESGNPYRLIGSDTDITQRKRDDESLRESEERLRLGLDAGDTGTWDWDIARNRLAWSERVYEFHGIKPGEFSGSVEDFVSLVHPDDVGWVHEEIQRCIQEHAPYQAEFRVVHPDGTVRWLTTSGKVFYSENGQPLRMLGATTDVTERRQAEEDRARLLESERAAREAAESASRAKDEFLATLSHELRTPLNSILGWSSLLRSGKMTEEESRDATESIERNARAQAQIIEDLLDMNRIMSGKAHLHVQPLLLSQIVDAAIETVRPAALAKHIQLKTQLDTSIEIAGDANRLQQVLWNLLSNAIKFTPREGKVEVELKRKDSMVEVHVRDSGEGIAPEFLPHVFERFRQADSSSTRRFGGLGLGLSIVKQLVELHGGSVQAYSEGIGHGASFCCTLPLQTVQADVSETDARPFSEIQPSVVTPLLHDVRILVVDDEPDARRLIQRVLEECKAQVVSTSSASEAISLLLGRDFDVLVSDIGMPGEDGYSLIKKLRAHERNSKHYTPALALTAFASAEDRLRAIRAGFQEHLAKPVEPAELVNMVACLAGRS